MGWFAANGRVALCFSSATLLQQNEVSLSRALGILLGLGFQQIHFDALSLLRAHVGTARYQRGAQPSEAPRVFDCSTLVKWWYALHGIGMRRYAVDQREQGCLVEGADAECGDLVFSAGRHPRYRDHPQNGVGHVGICTGEGTIVHAAGTRPGIVEVPQKDFSQPHDFRGMWRIAPLSDVLTFQIPADRCVEHTDDLIWLMLQSL